MPIIPELEPNLEHPRPATTVVVWVDDDRSSFQYIKRRLPRGLVQIIDLDDFETLGVGGFAEYVLDQGASVLVCVLANHPPPSEPLRKFVANAPTTAVITDLEMGGNPLAGVTVITSVGSVRPRPQTVIFSGKIDRAIETLASALGVDHVINKARRGNPQLLELLMNWFNFDRPHKDSERLESLGMMVDELRAINTQLKKERTSLKQQLRVAGKASSSIQPKKARSSTEDVAKLKRQITDLERLKQLVLAHHHDLTNTSSFTVQTLDQIMGEPKLLPPVITVELERARISAKHCDVLVSSLATLSTRIDEREESSPASVERALSEAIQIAERKVPEKVGLTYRVPNRLPLCAIPEHLLVRCILNVLLNSLEAMPNGGTIEVLAKPPLGQSKFLQVIVRDNGKGIKKVDIPKVFDPDFSTKGKQHGLGLFIVKKIFDDYGGLVSLKSDRGKGTQISLKIPKA